MQELALYSHICDGAFDIKVACATHVPMYRPRTSSQPQVIRVLETVRALLGLGISHIDLSSRTCLMLLDFGRILNCSAINASIVCQTDIIMQGIAFASGWLMLWWTVIPFAVCIHGNSSYKFSSKVITVAHRQPGSMSASNVRRL